MLLMLRSAWLLLLFFLVNLKYFTSWHR